MTKNSAASIKNSPLFWSLSPFIAAATTLLLEFIRHNYLDNLAVALLSLLTGLTAVILFLVAPAIATTKSRSSNE